MEENDYLEIERISVMEKGKILNTVMELPEEVDLEHLIEKLIFMEKVEKGLAQIKEGKTIPHSQVKELVKQW